MLLKGILIRVIRPLSNIRLQLIKQKLILDLKVLFRPTLTEVATLNLTIPIYSGGITSAQTYEAMHHLEIAQLRI